MGGAVSSGRDNQELVDNLMSGSYIRTRAVERVFRTLDRGDYMTPEARDQAYKDLAWRHGPLHLSAPCIYSEVMEALELRPGLSFLNIGSGTGYLTSLVGLIIGSSGISHGVEIYPFVVDYASRKIGQFIENSATLDEFDFCEPRYYCGNGLCLAPLQSPYDRVYCGAGCPDEYENYFKQLIKVGGVLVMPLNDNLVQIRRVAVNEWTSRSLLTVSFASLRVPTKDDANELVKLEELRPPPLQVLSRAVIRLAMRRGLLRRHPELREPPPRAPPPRRACPRRICIPIDDDSDVEGLNALHDLDHNTGANEMNALLSLVLSMGQNRVAGALRFDSLDSDSDSDAPGPQARGGPARGPPPRGQPARFAPRPSPAGEPFPFHATVEVDMSEPPPPPPRPASTLPRSARASTAPPTPSAPSAEDGPSASQPSTSTDGESKDASDENKKSDDDDDDPPGPQGGSVAAPPREREGGSGRACMGVLTLRFQERLAARMAQAGAPHEPLSHSMPAEVEIYLGKNTSAASRSLHMDWEPDVPPSGEVETENEPERSKEGEGEGSGQDHSKCAESSDSEHAGKVHKRQKLDSGIGEGSSASTGSSPPTRSTTDEGVRRRAKRGRWQPGGASSSSPEEEGSGARRRRRPGQSNDARRVRFSIVMKRAVKELPLPYALKKFVNLGRCFEF